MFSLPLLFSSLARGPSARSQGRKRRRLAATARRISNASAEHASHGPSSSTAPVDDVALQIACVSAEIALKLDDTMRTHQSLVTKISKMSSDLASLTLDVETLSQLKVTAASIEQRLENQSAELAKVERLSCEEHIKLQEGLSKLEMEIDMRLDKTNSTLMQSMGSTVARSLQAGLGEFAKVIDERFLTADFKKVIDDRLRKVESKYLLYDEQLSLLRRLAVTRS